MLLLVISITVRITCWFLLQELFFLDQSLCNQSKCFPHKRRIHMKSSCPKTKTTLLKYTRESLENIIQPNIHTTKLRFCILNLHTFYFSRVHVYYRPKIRRLSRAFSFALFFVFCYAIFEQEICTSWRYIFCPALCFVINQKRPSSYLDSLS